MRTEKGSKESDLRSLRTALDFTEDKPDNKSRTRQGDRESTDINVMMARFVQGGEIPPGFRVPRSMDFDGVFDFQEMQNIVRAGQENFNALPADLRKRFGNSPEEFVAFCLDEKNTDELIKLGLVVKPEPVVESAPLKVQVVNPVVSDVGPAK